MFKKQHNILCCSIIGMKKKKRAKEQKNTVFFINYYSCSKIKRVKVCLMECLMLLLQHKETLSQSIIAPQILFILLLPFSRYIFLLIFLFPIWFLATPTPLTNILPITSSPSLNGNAILASCLLPSATQFFVTLQHKKKKLKEEEFLCFFLHIIMLRFFFFIPKLDAVCGLEGFNTPNRIHPNTHTYIDTKYNTESFLNYVFYAKFDTKVYDQIPIKY